MTGWRSAPLGDLTTIFGGGTPARANSEFYGGEIPWVTPKDMKSWEIQGAQINITPIAVENSATRVVPKNSVLIVVRSGVLKHTLPVAIARVPVAINQDMKALVCDSDVCADYLAHFIKARSSTILQWVRATTADNFPVDKLKRLHVPLPPPSEQRRIAEMLDRAEALRAKRRAALDRLDTLAQAIFFDVFGDPVANTKRWPWKKLGDVGSIARGVSKHRPRNAPELLGGPYPFVQTGDVANSGGYIREFTNTYSETGFRQSRIWPKGTLCITIAANIAKTGILMFDACFPDSVVGFRSSESATVEYVRAWLSFLQASLEERAPESAQKNINLDILRNLEIPFPPIELQRAFATELSKIDELRGLFRDSMSRVDELFASLQARAFRGEL